MQSAEHQRNAGRVLGVIIAVCLEGGRRFSVPFSNELQKSTIHRISKNSLAAMVRGSCGLWAINCICKLCQTALSPS